MSFSSANVINSLYTGCDKDKKQTSPKKDEEIVELLKKLKKLESEQKESDAKFQAYVKTSNEQQRTIEEKYKNQIAALQKEVLDLKTRLDTEQKRNLELSQKLTACKFF
jgi:predicted transcriptional regulator